MSKIYIEWRKHKNIRPVELPNKEKIYMDLMNIEHSWSGRMDVWELGNTFIMEAEQMLINAIVLFEMGYFDSAYYSLRSAIDVATTIIFLSDMPEAERTEYIAAWKDTKDFPMQGQMVKLLAVKGAIFADMRVKMPDFFAHAKAVNARLNKYVHKQGLRYFYVSRNHIKNNRSQDTFIHNFEYHLKECIGIVAVMRLAIDPFPILLMDEEILYRSFDGLTEPYSEDFVDEYVGEATLAAYKTTDLYSGTFEEFMKYEKKPPAVFDVTHNQYIDSSQMGVLLDNLSLMTQIDVFAVLIVYACAKVVKVYCYNGMHMYFTDGKSNRDRFELNGEDFTRFAGAEDKFNQPYDEAYISVFMVDGEPYFAEHNESLDLDDIGKISGFLIGALFKMRETDCKNKSQ